MYMFFCVLCCETLHNLVASTTVQDRSFFAELEINTHNAATELIQVGT